MIVLTNNIHKCQSAESQLAPDEPNEITESHHQITMDSSSYLLWLSTSTMAISSDRNNDHIDSNINSNNNHHHYNHQISQQHLLRNSCYSLVIIIILSFSLMIHHCSASVFQQKGCHLVGHTQKVEIPGCINFELTSNACRGYCVSYAIPSNQETLLVNDRQMITSVGNCCAMTETEVMSVRVMCRNGPKDIKFKSATKCGCFHCKKY